MKYVKAILLALLVCSFTGAMAGKKGKTVQQKVYIFGFSASFVDSVAYLTDVMELDSATILSNGFLAERQLYSLQLESYVLEHFNLANSTNAVFFSKKRKDMDAKHEKMNRRYQRSANLALIYLGEDDFRFHPEEHVEATELTDSESKETDSTATDSTEQGASDDGNKTKPSATQDKKSSNKSKKTKSTKK